MYLNVFIKGYCLLLLLFIFENVECGKYLIFFKKLYLFRELIDIYRYNVSCAIKPIPLHKRSKRIEGIGSDFLVIDIPITSLEILGCLNRSILIRSVVPDEGFPIELFSNFPSPPERKEAIFPSNFTSFYQEKLIKGSGVKVAIFDTGVGTKHPYIRNVVERIDFTDDHVLNDTNSHGTFVAGVIGSIDPYCSGIAPEADLYIFRVFNSVQLSFTSWFLDAFNYALYIGIDIINFSIGGPDHFDQPFIDKINELTANGIIIISAIGNDGPIWASPANPADMFITLGVGGWGGGQKVADFSTRGMSSSELPGGFGHVRPDIIAPSVRLSSASATAPYKCRLLSGTSVACPVMTGIVALLLSTAKSEFNHATKFQNIHNIAAMKQIILSSATRLQGPSIFEQGAGLINVSATYYSLYSHSPHVSIFPSHISNLPVDCPYYWPWCTQQLFLTSQPLLVNFTVYNSIEMLGRIVTIKWTETYSPLNNSSQHGSRDSKNNNNETTTINSFQHEIDIDDSEEDRTREASRHDNIRIFKIQGGVVDVKLQFNPVLYPWSGFVALSLSVATTTASSSSSLLPSSFLGVVHGVLTVTTASSRSRQEPVSRYSEGKGVAEATIDLLITEIVPRERRVLWDVFHGINYPSAFIPRDNLNEQSVELLRGSWSCFSANHYSLLILADTEESFYPQELLKLVADINTLSLSILVLCDWYDEQLLYEIRMFDENTQSLWYPVAAGANVLGLNELLRVFRAGLGTRAFGGKFSIGKSQVKFSSGNVLVSWPKGGLILETAFRDILPVKSTGGNLRANAGRSQAVAGFLQTQRGEAGAPFPGRVVVYGDSSCLEIPLESKGTKDAEVLVGCRVLLDGFLQFLLRRDTPHVVPDLRRYFESNSSNMSNSYSNHSRTIKFPKNNINSNNNNNNKDEVGLPKKYWSSLRSLEADYNADTAAEVLGDRYLNSLPVAVRKEILNDRVARMNDFAKCSKVMSSSADPFFNMSQTCENIF